MGSHDNQQGTKASLLSPEPAEAPDGTYDAITYYYREQLQRKYRSVVLIKKMKRNTQLNRSQS